MPFVLPCINVIKSGITEKTHKLFVTYDSKYINI